MALVIAFRIFVLLEIRGQYSLSVAIARKQDHMCFKKAHHSNDHPCAPHAASARKTADGMRIFRWILAPRTTDEVLSRREQDGHADETEANCRPIHMTLPQVGERQIDVTCVIEELESQQHHQHRYEFRCHRCFFIMFLRCHVFSQVVTTSVDARQRALPNGVVLDAPRVNCQSACRRTSKPTT